MWKITDIFIHWYERLYHWCVSIIVMGIFIKSIWGNLFVISTPTDEYWGYEKIVIYNSFFAVSSQNFIKMIWAPLSLIPHLNHTILCYVINIGKFRSLMYCERRLLCVEKTTYLIAIFSLRQQNYYKMIWAPLSFMHQQSYDVLIYKINSGKFSYCMYHERWILGVWKKCSFFFNFFIFSL